MRNTLMTSLAGLSVTACLTASASVSVIDVTTATSSGNGMSANGAVFNFADPQPTGTGYIDPFLREQNTGSELGVNTSIKGQVILNTIAFDNKDPVNYTHDLAISSLLPVGNNYKFALDANQIGNGPISLIRFQLYVSDTAFTDATALGNFLNNSANVAFDMNGDGTTHRVDITSNSGSGSGDMTVLVPKVGNAGQYLYLVAGFGVDVNGGGYASNDGFEEWSAATGTPPPPGAPDSASAIGLLGIALSGLEILRRKIKA